MHSDLALQLHIVVLKIQQVNVNHPLLMAIYIPHSDVNTQTTLFEFNHRGNTVVAYFLGSGGQHGLLQLGLGA